MSPLEGLGAVTTSNTLFLMFLKFSVGRAQFQFQRICKNSEAV